MPTVLPSSCSLMYSHIGIKHANFVNHRLAITTRVGRGRFRDTARRMPPVSDTRSLSVSLKQERFYVLCRPKEIWHEDANCSHRVQVSSPSVSAVAWEAVVVVIVVEVVIIVLAITQVPVRTGRTRPVEPLRGPKRPGNDVEIGFVHGPGQAEPTAHGRVGAGDGRQQPERAAPYRDCARETARGRRELQARPAEVLRPAPERLLRQGFGHTARWRGGIGLRQGELLRRRRRRASHRPATPEVLRELEGFGYSGDRTKCRAVRRVDDP